MAGFDISSDQTEFTWNFIGGANYRFLEWLSAFAGYRIMNIELEEGSGADRSEADLEMSGPVVGFVFYF